MGWTHAKPQRQRSADRNLSHFYHCGRAYRAKLKVVNLLASVIPAGKTGKRILAINFFILWHLILDLIVLSSNAQLTNERSKELGIRKSLHVYLNPTISIIKFTEIRS